jgi:predicted RNA-binding Zn-ribbon protein involved in translation (DUF1610 family)
MKAAEDLASLRRRLVQQGQLEAHTLFECPTCGDRQLGQRRCADCQHFCRAVASPQGVLSAASSSSSPDLFSTEVPYPN